MRLSILICHLPQRAELLRRLLDVLNPQIYDCGCPGAREVILHDGPGTTGAKRNELLARASGDYICFIDDDDLVPGDYVARILAAAETNPDVIGMEGVMTRGGDARHHPQRFIHSIRYDRWFDEGDWPRKTYFRPPNHLNPVKRELALAAGFPDQTSAEDRDYSMALRPMLTTEVFAGSDPLYFYLADSD